MNPYDTIQYLTKQAEFCGNRALKETSVEGIRMYATRADIYYTFATALSILFSIPAAAKNTGVLGDADDKVRELQS
jgi:hypothetical protein